MNPISSGAWDKEGRKADSPGRKQKMVARPEPTQRKRLRAVKLCQESQTLDPIIA